MRILANNISLILYVSPSSPLPPPSAQIINGEIQKTIVHCPEFVLSRKLNFLGNSKIWGLYSININIPSQIPKCHLYKPKNIKLVVWYNVREISYKLSTLSVCNVN